MASPRSRNLGRGVSAAVFATFVALMSHLLGGGAMPGPLGLLVPLLVALPLCVLLMQRRVTLLRLAAAVTGSQVLFHTLFVLGTPVSGTVQTTGDHAGHAAGTGTIVVTAAHTGHASPTMWLWHAVAAVATTIALHGWHRSLARVRATLARIRRACSRLLDRVPATNPPAGPSRAVSPAHVAPARLSAGAWEAWRRRGPPRTALA